MTKSLSLLASVALCVFCLSTDVGATAMTALTSPGSLQATKSTLELPLLERLSTLRAQPHAYENLKALMFNKANSMDVRWKAVTAMSHVGKVADAKADLVRTLQAPEWYMRNAGLIALSNLDHSSAVSWARRLLSDKALIVRSAAVDVISQSHDITSSGLLWEKLYAKENYRGHQSLFIRRRIVEALADIEGKANAGKFVAILQDKDSTLHEPAMEALARITKANVTSPSAPLATRRTQWENWYKQNKATL